MTWASTGNRLNAVSATGTRTYTHDAAGHRTAETSKAIVWRAENLAGNVLTRYL
jgi:hypothetical protein